MTTWCFSMASRISARLRETGSDSGKVIFIDPERVSPTGS
jgi:hypothetical protein